MTDRRIQIVREVADEWRAAGRLHEPPDDTSRDDDLGFFAEVERRLEAEGLALGVGKDRPHRR